MERETGTEEGREGGRKKERDTGREGEKGIPGIWGGSHLITGPAACNCGHPFIIQLWESLS
jgi:hypothetical protein